MVYLKNETVLPTGSFKVRGAMYALSKRMEIDGAGVSEVVAASTGNHGAAVAFAARTLGVQARIFLRKAVAMFGIAPLTSMYLSGENQPRMGGFRPEVHDSDGLLVATGSGEWLWRPLLNPRQTLTTSFSLDRLQGFGVHRSADSLPASAAGTGASLAPSYFHVTSMPKKCMNTSRFGRFFGFCCGLRM